MTVDHDQQDVEAQFAEWRAYMSRRHAVRDTDVDELEDHLRGTVAELVELGLRRDEAFLVAVKRMGSQDELSMTQEQNMLLVTGEKKGVDKAEYLHRGIAGRAFERRFQLADHVKVTGAGLENGLLTIDLKREIPEEMKPRRIEIGSVAAAPNVAQRKIEAEKQAA